MKLDIDTIHTGGDDADVGNTTRPTWPLPTTDSASAPFLINFRAVSRKSHADVFPAPSRDVRLLDKPFIRIITQTPLPSSDLTTSSYAASAYEVPLDTAESARAVPCTSLARCALYP